MFPDSYKWTKIAYNGEPEDIPYQRYGHTAVAYKGCCYIYGGRNDVNGVSEHLYQFNVGMYNNQLVILKS